jgi:hypothetical protein
MRVARIPQEKRDPPGPVARAMAGGITGGRITPLRGVHARTQSSPVGRRSLTERCKRQQSLPGQSAAIETPCCACLGELSAA